MALLPPSFLDCVVAIGNPSKNWIGTGFLFGKLVQRSEDNQNTYTIYLVSNKHVLEQQTQIMLRFNPQDDNSAKDYPLSLKDSAGNNIWIGHPNKDVDVAIIQINALVLQEEGMKFSFFQSDSHIFTKDKLIEIGATEGDFIYVLGFPMGIVAKDRQHVILRGGVIARIRDLFENRSTDFIVDAFVFPGNSGGPVILKPEIISIGGTKSNKSAGLIGVVKSYIPYSDVAISQQTGKPRVLFEDNSGLSIVEPVDYILETIEESERIHNPNV